MIRVRYCKIALVASVALFATLVAFNNITDYGANFKFVQHVLMMDTIFPDSRQTWRAVGSPLLHHAAYIAIILLQVMIAFLCWTGAAALFKTVHEDATAFERAKGTGSRSVSASGFSVLSGSVGNGT
jgi:predicted small integral membrane protein